MKHPESENAIDSGQPDRIERQLLDEADRLLGSLDQFPPTAALLAEHHRRARVRRVRRTVCSIVGVLMIVGTVGLTQRIWPARPVANPEGPVNGARSVVPESALAEESSGGGLRLTDLPSQPPPGKHSVVAFVEWEPDPSLPPAVPVLITLPEGDKQKVIATGIYVPEYTEQVDLLDLTPAEQHAVRQVLGIPEENPLREPI